MINSKIKPPKPSASDDRYAVFFAAISMLPWVGPIIAEALKRRWPSKFEKALAQWHIDSTAQSNRLALALSKIQSTEEGENANGMYRRIGDGTQEVEARIEAVSGYNRLLYITFPASFIRPPIVHIFDESHKIKVEKVGLTSAEIKLLEHGYQETISFRYQANGRWQ